LPSCLLSTFSPFLHMFLFMSFPLLSAKFSSLLSLLSFSNLLIIPSLYLTYLFPVPMPPLSVLSRFPIFFSFSNLVTFLFPSDLAIFRPPSLSWMFII
jgi:hypothetical protein